ncbi:phage minor capsid protein [Companilactobacillus allii]|uniref:Capsid protein n=1 Tax=Companilactobacillus allii TaxID=1847728 RepID=A0A1P8Q4V2_9LACO|nr:phage minor capsid protein [Companilactobacillus allii]APX72871.1 hypothetical protein BTM29_10050 [Companilactobacillus allii]USQ67659.1 phage minor capsid protein [Companilactobacillus allii]
MKLSPWELELLAASQAKRMQVLEDELWNILIEVSSNAIDGNDLNDASTTQEWLNEVLEYRKQLKVKSSKPIQAAFDEVIKKLQDQLNDETTHDMSEEEIWLMGMVESKLLNFAPKISESKKIKKIISNSENEGIKYLGLAASNLPTHLVKMFETTFRDAIRNQRINKITTQKAVAQSLYELNKHNIPALIDKGGKRWSLDVYTKLVVTNTINNNYNRMAIQRFKDYGGNLVKISSHADCRPTHYQYQDKIYSLTGESTDYPNLYKATNYGNGGGLCGLNCRHHPMPYIPTSGDYYNQVTSKKDSDHNYKLVQQQHRYERVLRQAKRDKAIAEKMGNAKDVEHYKWLVKGRSKRLTDFKNNNGLTK